MQGNAPDEEHEDPHGARAHEIDRLRRVLENLRVNLSMPGPDPAWKLKMACEVIDGALAPRA